MLPEIWNRYLDQQREEREARKLGRKLRPMRHLGPTRVQIGSHELINFSSNDYLGLASDLRIAEAAASAAGRYGWGTGASRLVTGSSTLHAKLEYETARFRGSEAALLYGSGYQANLGVISGLAGPGDTVLSDALNHASIIAGCRLSGASVKIFKHGDMDELERKLSGAQGTRCVVVTDTIFSIKGDAADLPQIVSLCERFKALLIIDDAHGNACIGKDGRGLPEDQGVLQHAPIVVGTYSKALGSYGGFVACSEQVREHLVNSSRPFIYTTALPIAVTAANIEALKILDRDGDKLRATLASNVRLLRSRLHQAEFVPTGKYHIVGIPMDSPERALAYAEQIETQGALVYPMRWPSVPEGEDTLRVSVSAAHTEDDINRLVTALKIARDRTGGKDTGSNQRSAPRPTRRMLALAEPEFDIDETGFEIEDDSNTILTEPISAADSARLPNVGDLVDFDGEPADGTGRTMIIQQARMEIVEDEHPWSDVEDDDLSEVSRGAPDNAPDSASGFELMDDAPPNGDEPVAPTIADDGDSIPPEETAPEPVTVDGAGESRRRKRKRMRRKSRARGTRVD